jgi:membrane protease YdiL (CAAX protease family)
MTLAVSSKTYVYDARPVLPQTLQDTTKKIEDSATDWGLGVVGFGLGLGMHKICMPLTERIVKAFGSAEVLLSDPFAGFGLWAKILLTPFVCIVGPILEEYVFRGDLQGALKDAFEPFFEKLGLEKTTANLAARITAVFFSSIVYGLVHFTNAIFFWCNPILFFPHVVYATLAGLILGLAKEAAGSLHLPIGMRIGNNTLAWAGYLAN